VKASIKDFKGLRNSQHWKLKLDRGDKTAEHEPEVLHEMIKGLAAILRCPLHSLGRMSTS
jgi:hypothetical protein